VIRQAHPGLSERRVCELVGTARSSYRYPVSSQRRQGEAELRGRLRELAAERRRFGYRRLKVLLRREGWRVNHKRVYRLYREEGLLVRRRKRKRIGAAERRPLPLPTRTNERWSMDFVADALSDGRRFRSLNPSADGWMITIADA
jgi:putative transposase